MNSIRQFLVLLALGLVAAIPVPAAAPAGAVDLGQGLAYFRVHSLAADAAALEAAVDAGAALVIDVRYAQAEAADAVKWEHALARRRGSALLCVLVSPATPEALGPALADGHYPTLGIAGSVPPPQVVVAQKPAADRQAYEALESGTALATLLSGRIGKERYDEEALMHDFSNGNTAGEPPPPDAKNLKDAPDKPERIVDRVLQRALHLHRALAALKQRG